MKLINKLVVHSHDVMYITGCSGRSARRLLATIRKENKKQRSAPVTVDEFCHYTGFTKEQVIPYL